jgi:hypothetical protein
MANIEEKYDETPSTDKQLDVDLNEQISAIGISNVSKPQDPISGFEQIQNIQPQQQLQYDDYKSNMIITLVPELPMCAQLQLDATIMGKHQSLTLPNIRSLYLLNMHNKKCPPPVDNLGIPLNYWLAINTDNSKALYASKYFPGDKNQTPKLMTSEGDVIHLKTVIIRSMDNNRSYMILGDITGNVQNNDIQWGDKKVVRPDLTLLLPKSAKMQTSVRMSDGTVVNVEDPNQASILQKQQDLMTQQKPPLVRQRNLGRAKGLGIQELQTEEFKREWRALPKNAVVNIRVDVTEPDGDYITSVVVKASIKERYEKSQVLNGLGVVYELLTTEIDGNDNDVYLYTPLQIGTRKIKYWLCVYYDLYDNKIIATSDISNHKQLIEGERLAEYMVGDIKRIDNQPSVVPQMEIKPVQPRIQTTVNAPTTTPISTSVSPPATVGVQQPQISTARIKTSIPIHAPVMTLPQRPFS